MTAPRTPPLTFPADPEYLRRKVPPRDATVTGAVGGEVAVRRDRWGIAHVRATTRTDLAFGLGYATAQECLWRLELCRRQARGELAALLGRDALPSDRLMHRLGLGRHADALAGRLPADLAGRLTAFAAGVNRWLEEAEAAGALPVELDWLGCVPRPWTPADSIAVWKHRWWTLTGRLEGLTLGEAARRHLTPELHRRFMAAELGEETIVPGEGTASAGPSGAGVPGGADEGEGSNNWAVAGSRTTTGYPVLCSDPHNPFTQPGQWFQAQLTLESGSLDVAGAVYAGTPGVYFGRNRHLAWGFTNHVASNRDLYVERVDPAGGERYLESGEWRPFSVETVRIAVRDEADDVLEVRRTVRGPLVDSVLPALEAPGSQERGHGPPVSLRWAGLEVDTGLDALLALNEARSVDEGLAALAGWVCPVANALLADGSGRIAYHVIGRVPHREVTLRGYRDAADPAAAWRGFIPYEHLPQLADPSRGWLATANQPPWRTDPPGLSYLAGAAWADGWRMRRIATRLTAAPRLSPAEIGAVQGDTVGGRAAELAPVVVDLLRGATGAPAELAGHLSGWNGDYAVTQASKAPTVWTAFWERWLRRVAGARFPAHLVPLVAGQAGAVARDILLGRDPPVDGGGESWLGEADRVEAVAEAAAGSMAWLRERLGPDTAGWDWGSVHTVTWRHALSESGPADRRAAAAAVFDVGPFSTSGTTGTVRAAGYAAATPFRVTSGSTYRMVADLSPGGGLLATTTTGQSGHPASPHYADQAPLWNGDALHPFPMDGFEPEGVTRILPVSR